MWQYLSMPSEKARNSADSIAVGIKFWPNFIYTKEKHKFEIFVVLSRLHFQIYFFLFSVDKKCIKRRRKRKEQKKTKTQPMTEYELMKKNPWNSFNQEKKSARKIKRFYCVYSQLANNQFWFIRSRSQDLMELRQPTSQESDNMSRALCLAI